MCPVLSLAELPRSQACSRAAAALGAGGVAEDQMPLARTCSPGSPKFPTFVTGFHTAKLSPSLESCFVVGRRVDEIRVCPGLASDLPPELG